jgi:hypothetical protein
MQHRGQQREMDQVSVFKYLTFAASSLTRTSLDKQDAAALLQRSNLEAVITR